MADDKDAERFRQLYEATFRRLLGYVLRRVDQAEDAADVVAETYLVAWRRLEWVPSGDEALPWLIAVSTRLLSNQRRGRLRRNNLADKLRTSIHLQIDVEPTADSPILRAMSRIPDSDRQILLMQVWDELTGDQIAALLSISPVTVRTRLHRARSRLRQEMQRGTGTRGATLTEALSRDMKETT